MSRRYCFTINNPTPADEQRLTTLGSTPRSVYFVFGRERGTAGTPHLQGFVIFSGSVRLAAAKALIGDRAHLEPARGTSLQASDYCKKDGDFVELGTLPGPGQGKRTDWDKFREWVEELGRPPTTREIIRFNPSLYARYSKKCTEIAHALLPTPKLVPEGAQPRVGFQEDVVSLVDNDAHPRQIHFFVDEEGGIGKSWICRYLLTHNASVQYLRIGKRDDLAYAIDETKTTFLFDIQRGQMTYLQYSVLESLKDQMIFSAKYESSLKTLQSIPTVIVFSNEHPEMNQLTEDRYDITILNN